jgi:type IV pilus assembly protein PilY1
LIGTGQLLSDNDVAGTQRQSFYAIVDGLRGFGKFYNASITTTLGGTTITHSGTAFPDNFSAFPVTRGNMLAVTDLLVGIGNYSAAQVKAKPMGWYFDLNKGATSPFIAERVSIGMVAAGNGVVAFAASLPNGDVCSPAGTSRVFAFNFGTAVSVLTSGGSAIAAISLTSTATDIGFRNVGGQPGLVVSGETLTNQPTKSLAGASYKKLNWRELRSPD